MPWYLSEKKLMVQGEKFYQEGKYAKAAKFFLKATRSSDSFLKEKGPNKKGKGKSGGKGGHVVKPMVCVHWLKGNCRHGNDCKNKTN